LLLCLTAALLIRLGIFLGWFTAPDTITITQIVSAHSTGAGGSLCRLAAVLLSIFFYLNLLLFVFNLIPLPPLDGGSVPLLCLSQSAAEKYTAFTKSPGMSMVGMILAWQLFGAFAPGLHHWAIQMLYPALHYS
jgi:Zn-dependent protease